MASLALVVACGGKKADTAEAGEQATEQTDEEQPADEAEATEDGEAPAKLDIVVDETVADAQKAIYANGDFKPFTGVFFKDDFTADKVGEFPAKWSLNNGSAEVAKFNDRQVLNLSNNDAEVTPKVAGNSKYYLPEAFTFEFEYFCNGDEDFNAGYHLNFETPAGTEEINLITEENVNWNLPKKNEEWMQGTYEKLGDVEKKNSWNHFALSYINGTLKLYVNGTRVASLPDVLAPRCLAIHGEGWDDHRYYFTNVRLTTEAPAGEKK
ncbi:MAG: hypothetical protein IJ928_01655 [Prevotella sp.]|jgi:hypothetical protein|nr:hypothetical protein [Prevotella sp.]